MTCHYADVGSASDLPYCVGNLLQPIRSTTQNWIAIRHQYGISACTHSSDVISRGNQCWVASRIVGCFLRLTGDISRWSRILPVPSWHVCSVVMVCKPRHTLRARLERLIVEGLYTFEWSEKGVFTTKLHTSDISQKLTLVWLCNPSQRQRDEYLGDDSISTQRRFVSATCRCNKSSRVCRVKYRPI